MMYALIYSTELPEHIIVTTHSKSMKNRNIRDHKVVYDR